MEFRFKELIRYIIPGFYLLLQVGLVVAYRHWDSILRELSENYAEGLIAIFVFLSPVIAYFIGYFVEALASNMEYYMYKVECTFKRPSYLILTKQSKRYQVKGIDGVSKMLGMQEHAVRNNKEAKEIFDVAHQKVGGSELLDEFLFQSMVARNLFCTQFLLCLCSIPYLITIDGSPWKKIIEFVLYSIFTWIVYVRWVQRSKTYTKHVFIEYIKQCKDKTTTNTIQES